MSKRNTLEYVGELDLLVSRYGFYSYRKNELYELWLKRENSISLTLGMKVKVGVCGRNVLEIIHPNATTYKLLCQMWADGVIRFIEN